MKKASARAKVARGVPLGEPQLRWLDSVAESIVATGGPSFTRTDILQSLSAHFLTWLNIWQDEGFRPVHDQWLFRAEGREAPIRITQGGGSIEGQVMGLDEGANLLLKTPAGEVRSLSFLDHVDMRE